MSTFSSILLAIVGIVGAFLGWKIKGGLASREINKAKDATIRAEKQARIEQARRRTAQKRANIMESKARATENALKKKNELDRKEQQIDEEQNINNHLDTMFDVGFDGLPDMSRDSSGRSSKD